MNKINETIALRPNEGLEIEISRLAFQRDPAPGLPTPPSWTTVHLTAAEIEAHIPHTAEDGTILFTEDNLECYLMAWISTTYNAPVKTFRWLWDKYRTTKAA